MNCTASMQKFDNLITKIASITDDVSKSFYYISIYETSFELHIFWPSDTESRIKLTFSESALLSLKMRLMTSLNMPQDASNVPA